MKKLILVLIALLLCTATALADDEWDFNISSTGKTRRAAPIYSVEYVPDIENPDNTIPAYTQIGTIPGNIYLHHLQRDKVNYFSKCSYYLNGVLCTAWLRYQDVTDDCTPVYFTDDNATIHNIHDLIANDPVRLAEYMNEHYPGRGYTTIPPWQWDENPPEGYVAATPTPAPEPPTDKPASTEKTAATKKPSDSTSATKKPMTTKKAKATATPAPTEVPAPEAWLSADWLAENVDADCTERREVGIVRLGVVDSDVTLDGVDYTVPTDALTFAEGVKDKHRIAAIYAPRTGRCILRAKASEKAKELDKCPAGTIVSVLEYGKSWTKIRYDGQVGYVKTSVLTFLGNKGEPIGTGVTSYQGKATGNAQVPVRNGKTSEAEIIVNLRTATEVTVLSFDGKWYEIDHDGWYGFLYKSYFMFDDE